MQMRYFLLDKGKYYLYNVYRALDCALLKITTGGENNANIQPVSKKRTSDI